MSVFAPLPFVELGIVDFDNLELERTLTLMVLLGKFHVCKNELSIIVMLHVEVSSERHVTRDIFCFARHPTKGGSHCSADSAVVAFILACTRGNGGGGGGGGGGMSASVRIVTLQHRSTQVQYSREH